MHSVPISIILLSQFSYITKTKNEFGNEFRILISFLIIFLQVFLLRFSSSWVLIILFFCATTLVRQQIDLDKTNLVVDLLSFMLKVASKPQSSLIALIKYVTVPQYF